MITDFTRTIAYICPYCSNINKQKINIFSFNACRALVCADELCSEECISITETADKYKISIECPFCAETHTYSVSKGTFWNRELISFSCTSQPDIEIFFAGDEIAVEKTLSDYSDSLESLADSFNLDTMFTNLVYDTLEMLYILDCEKRLSCRCGSDNIKYEYKDDQIFITCEDCGKSHSFVPTDDIVCALGESSGYVLGETTLF